MKWNHILVALLLVLTASHAAKAEETITPAMDCHAAYELVPHGSLLDLLDPDADHERRMQALGHYQQLAAIKECPEFGYTLGLLYRHGPELPGNLLPQDIPKAKELILAMAESGYLTAYADLAEMVMRHGDPREAMKWTQVYLYFVRNVQRALMDPDQAQFNRSAYNGHLLNRAEIVWGWQRPSVARKRVREDLNAYIEVHGQKVSQLMRQRMQLGTEDTFQRPERMPRAVRRANDCYLNPIGRHTAGTASWIVEVLPSGQTGRVLLENFVPTVAVANGLRVCLDKREFEPFDGENSAIVRIPLMYGSPEGASLRR